MIHNTLGDCNKLITFKGNKNQLILVTAPKSPGYDKKDNKYKIMVKKFRHNDKHWILWGPIGVDESKLGKSCMLYATGRTWPLEKAIKEFMKICKTVDTLTMSKL
jgi:hypothetical protein